MAGYRRVCVASLGATRRSRQNTIDDLHDDVNRRQCIRWLCILGAEPSPALIGDLCDASAYYNGQKWVRITGQDIPVRDLLDRHGRTYTTGKPPAGLVSLEPGTGEIAALSTLNLKD